MANDKLNIGILTSHLEDDYANAVCRGAILGAEEQDVNLFIIPGRYLDIEYEDQIRTAYEYQYNTMFSYPNVKNMDGLLVMLGTIGTVLNHDEKLEFLKQYEGIPMMIIGSEMEGYSNIVFDNQAGLREEIEHMITVHGAKNIGFVSGPLSNVDAVERLDVYKSVLTKFGLPVLDERIVYGNFSQYSVDIVGDLLDRNPDLDAIIFANDQMAIGGYTAMQERSIQVGMDILVGGFDDAACCLKLIPNLTTVKADSVDLGYQSVRDVVQLIHNPNQEIHSKVDSTLLCRESCGCRGFEVQDIMQYTQIDIMKETSSERIATAINAYFFQQYHSTEAIEDCKKSVEEFVALLMKHCEEGVDQYTHEMIVNSFAMLVNNKLQNFISNDMIFNGMDVLFQKMFYLVKDEDKRFHVCQLMNDLYKRLMNENFANLKRQESGVKDLNHHINRITQDMLMFEHDDDAAYGMAVDKLNQLELASSYLFIFEEPIVHHKMEVWKRPDKAMLKAYNIGDKVYELSSEQQVTDIETLFRNPHLPDDHRYTMVFAPLYSGVEQYGLLLCELDESYFYFVTAITSQLFSAIKIIRLLREKEETKRQLQISLEQIKENNLILDEVAKSDELTKIYNRRGFLATAKALIKKKENQGLRALVMYADMDNLKIVNDRFGHEDGDFSLRFIADVLKEAVRSQDIVARMGGDEFAALVIVGNQENMAGRIRERIDELIMIKNAETDKEYFVNMSVGFHEFVCDEKADIMSLLDKADKNLYIEKKNKVKKIYKKDVYR